MKNGHPHIIRLFTAVLSVLVLSSCERPAVIDFPPHKPSLVLHGYIGVGDTIAISLGKTIGAAVYADDTATFVDNGWAVVYENGLFLDSLKFSAGTRRYISSFVTAKPGKTYKVEAGAPGFTSVWASATSPQSVPTILVSKRDSMRTTNIGQLLDDITVRFQDPASETNHYLMELYYPFASGADCVYSYEPSVERYKGELLPFDQNSCILNTEILFTDRSFNGTVKDITISARTDMLVPLADPVTGDVYRAYIKRYNISDAYYRYFKTWSSIEYNTGNPTMINPGVIRGNVENGYGLFTVFTVATDSLP